MTKKKERELNSAGVPNIVGIRPCGNSILIELLNEDEMIGTTLHLPQGMSAKGEGKLMDAPQAYVLDVGPTFKSDDWGFGVGDRVMLTGSLTPAPNFDKSKRKKGTVEPHFVKAVLLE